MRGTPKLARSRACGGASVRSPALRRAERARGFASLISSFDGDNGRRLRSRKLGKNLIRPSPANGGAPSGGHAARRKSVWRCGQSEWKVTTASLPLGQEQMLGGAQAPCKLEKLLVEIESECLKVRVAGCLGSSCLRPSTRATMSATRRCV